MSKTAADHAVANKAVVDDRVMTECPFESSNEAYFLGGGASMPPQRLVVLRSSHPQDLR